MKEEKARRGKESRIWWYQGCWKVRRRGSSGFCDGARTERVVDAIAE